MNERELEAGLAPTPGYRYAEREGHQLFVAGQVPLDGDGQLVGRADPARQAERCLHNLELLIALHDFAGSDIRHLTIHVVGSHDDLTAAWRAVVAWFGGEVPPATLLGASLLGHVDQLVEVDATIVRRWTR